MVLHCKETLVNLPELLFFFFWKRFSAPVLISVVPYVSSTPVSFENTYTRQDPPGFYLCGYDV